MPSSSEVPWVHRLQATVAALGPVPLGHLRLYRIQDRQPRPPAAWMIEAQRDQGILLARGRWFTAQPETLAFYAQDTPDPELRVVLVLQAVADRWAVSALPAILPDGSRPRQFSRAPEQEWFLPQDLADQARGVPWASSPKLARRDRPGQ